MLTKHDGRAAESNKLTDTAFIWHSLSLAQCALRAAPFILNTTIHNLLGCGPSVV